LLRLGATPLVAVGDLLACFGVQAPAALGPVEGDEGIVLAQLGEGSAAADELVRATGLDVGAVAGALTALELEGRVVTDGGVYRATPAPK
jgi:predicted Rossmann fold nucleotide-binding protein DprA/Smf involved in DNA uptake